MLIPSACTIWRSSTPARTIIPVRVNFSQIHSARPTKTAMPRMNSRKRLYCTSATCRSSNRSSASGKAMSLAMPPKCSSIRSAAMIETAIVISAWRIVLPLVPAQQHLLHDEPDADEQRAHEDRQRPLAPEAHLVVRQADVAEPDPAPLQLERDVAAQQEEGAVRHVDDAHESEDEREAAGDEEVEARPRRAVEQRREERVPAELLRQPRCSRARRSSRRRNATMPSRSTPTAACRTRGERVSDRTVRRT